MAYDLSAEPLATDLVELCSRYTGMQIVGLVRERLGVSSELRDPAVFRAAYKAYDDGTADTDAEALKAYIEFLADCGHEVTLKFARCLLPGSMH